MAKRRKRPHPVGNPLLTAASNPEERYQLALTTGKELATVLSGKKFAGVFPKESVGHFLYTRSASQLKAIYDYYSRPDIQRAMYQYAAGRKIAHLRLFQPQYNGISNPQDILPLTLCTLFEGGRYWPSLHGTVSRYGVKGNRICDVVIELDYKSSWKRCFEMTRPVIAMLEERGAVFRLKFSGHCSVHIIIPAEVLQIDGFPVEHSQFFRCLSDRVKKRIQESRYLDTSFQAHDHFLRLPYSVHELTGLVSLPFNVSDYDHFHPEQARPEKVKLLPGWWSIPRDASQQMQNFIRYVMGGQIALSTSKMGAVQLPAAPFTPRPSPQAWGEGKGVRGGGWQVDQKLVREARQRKKEAARKFLPNEGFYDRMLRLGQEAIDLRDFLLLEDRNSKVALRTLRHLHRRGREIDLDAIARKFNVDADDLKLLWNWEKQERPFRYYAQDEVKGAIYTHAERRKLRVGNEEKLVFLQEPADILPLIVYAHLCSDRAGDEYPVIYATNSHYERTGEIPIACDLKIEFRTKSETESPFEAAEPVIALLAGAGITFRMCFDGVKGLSLVIPYEALPTGARLASVRHANTQAQLAPYLKHSMRLPGATCTLVRDVHALSPIPYSIHPQTGLACVPIYLSQFRTFDRGDAQLGNVQVDNEWWHVPEDAPTVTAKFFKDIELL